jgi:tetratricopeptide (TPR) repeat protein
MPLAQAQFTSLAGGDYHLTAPGVMVHLSPEFTPAHLVGITIHPDNALQFDFLIHRGDDPLSDDQKKEEYNKLVKYFLASLTIPEKDQWVNLSPYEKNRIIKDDFGKTEMGRDLLAQDYILKQITSSLIYPEDSLGKKFWDRIYERAWKEYGTTNVPVNTFNKVWIIPDEALVYESGNTAYVLRNHLKVMLEEDYLSLEKHSGTMASYGSAPRNGVHSIGSQIIREIILPELEKEVNTGKNFANLRQIYSGMILATWYKHALKESLLGKIYADQTKVKGVDQDPKVNEQIYQQYLKAFKKGVFNYIKEEMISVPGMPSKEQGIFPRKYFSGGARTFTGAQLDPAQLTPGVVAYYDRAMPSNVLAKIDRTIFADNGHIDRTVVALNESVQDAAMLGASFKKIALAAVLALFPSIYYSKSEGFDQLYQLNQAEHEREITLDQAHQELKDNLDIMLTNLRKENSNVVPGSINAPHLRKIAGNAKTYEEFTHAVNDAVKPFRERYAAGSMTPAEIKEYAQIQNEILSWAYLFLHTNVSYDPNSFKEEGTDLYNLSYAIVGNPHLEGKPRTSVCGGDSELFLIILSDLGYGEEKSFSIVNVAVSYQGIKYDDRKEGHAAVLVKTVDGKARIIDLVQIPLGPFNTTSHATINDYLHAAMYGTPHKVIEVFNEQGEKQKIVVNSERDLTDKTGETLSILIKNRGYWVVIKQIVRDQKDIFKETREADALYAKKNYEEALVAYGKAVSDSGKEIEFLQNSKLGEINDMLTTYEDNNWGAVTSVGHFLLNQLMEKQSIAVMGEGGVVLDAVTAEINKANALYSQKDYEGASKAYMETMKDIDRKRKFLEDSGIDKINMDGWVDDKGIPIGKSWPFDQLSEKRAEVEKAYQNVAAVKATKPLGTPLADNKGGIDLNAAHLNLQIKRDGNGVPLPINMQDMEQLKNIQGFVPEIIEIKPALNLPILRELQHNNSGEV